MDIHITFIMPIHPSELFSNISSWSDATKQYEYLKSISADYFVKPKYLLSCAAVCGPELTVGNSCGLIAETCNRCKK